jgi:hypothetical protein
MFEDLFFDDQYVPDKEVLDSAYNLSGTAYDMGNCVDRLLCSDVISIKRVTNYKGLNPEGDIVLLISYEGWSIHNPYWGDPTDPKHSIDSICDYRCTALFLRSVLIKNEIDDQHGISAWVDIDLDIYTIKTTEAPAQVLEAYCDEIDHDWHEFVDQWLDCGKPDYSLVEPKVKKALNKAIAKYDKKIMPISEI